MSDDALTEHEGLRIARERIAREAEEEHDELHVLIKEHGADILGEDDFRKFKLMQDFANRVGDILATLADVVQPREFEALAQHGLVTCSLAP
jgi:hypothetical protein